MSGAEAGERKALVVDIRRNALDDGPGIRTLVFFKGCNLDCAWCHNPETKASHAELMFDARVCLGCGDCAESCPRGAIDLEGSGRIDRERCDRCMACVEACPSGALKVAGRVYTAGALRDELMRDEPFYRHSGGGVTFSGGEPTLHVPFLAELARSLKQGAVHVNIETNGLYRPDPFEDMLLPHLDMIFFDIKFVDAALHERYTGKPSAAILRNFERLLRRATVPVIARVPLVPGVTATRENLEAIASFLRGLGVGSVELLEYNPLWIDKARGLGQSPAYTRPEFMTREDKDEARSCFPGFDTGRF